MPNDIAREVEKLADELGIDRKRSIGEVAKELKVEAHVIRFWEEKFPQIKPEIGAGKRRYYYNKQFKVLKKIKQFLYEEGYTIAGLQKLLKKRKLNNYKDEDLDTILEVEFSEQEKAQLLAEKNQENFALEDFIISKTNQKIDDNLKMQLFANLKNAKQKLEKLKSLFV
ncbi:MAG: MerR family transcriptional regulator [Proteobacteria bacterium]|nr:MerR family transcriptional regulator [Pseudomonadota bacterium]